MERLAPTIPVAGSAVRGLVPREPLFDRLSAAGPGEVVLVGTPAGNGKTILLRSWVESTGVADRVGSPHPLRAPQAARARATAARACWTAPVSAPPSRAIWCASSRSDSSTRPALRRLGCVRR